MQAKRSKAERKEQEMRKMKKATAVILCLTVMAVSLVACGDSKDNSTSAPDAPAATEAAPVTTEASASVTIASTETWGDYTVGIPEGWTFRKGYALNEDDTTCCSVKKSDFSKFDFNMESEDMYMKKYDQNKATYTQDQKDVSGKYGDIDWTGFEYSNGFELYGKANGKPVRVSCSGFKFDSPETKAVLESLKIK